MEKIRTSFPLKFISVLLIAVLTATMLFFSAVAVVDAYASDDFERKSVLEDMLDSENNDVYIYYSIYYRNIPINEYDFDMYDFSSNIMMEVKNENGEIIHSNLEDVPVQAVSEKEYTRTWSKSDADVYGNYIEESNSEIVSEKFTIILYLKQELVNRDKFWVVSNIWNSTKLGNSIIYVGVCALAILVLFVYLMCSAGHKAGVDGVHISRFDHFPIDVLLLLCAGIVSGAVLLIAYMLDEYWNYSFYADTILLFTCTAACAVVGTLIASLTLTLLSVTAAVRLKTKTFIKSTLIYKICHFIFKGLRKLWRIFKSLIKRIPTVWRTVLAVGAILFIGLFTFAMDIAPAYYLLTILLGTLAIIAAVLIRDVLKGTEEIANGHPRKISTKYLFGDIKAHAENINRINDGIVKAVDERMQSERFKTELITNVSHDIKTPLTSIINYVDLLEKEQINNDTALQYIEVLTRQSARLKKLIDDLIEASKASTGNLPVNLLSFDVGIIMSQAMGEYAEKLSAANLELIVNKPDEPMFIKADSRHLWRVLDNVFNNIAKYAQPHTRVYVDIMRRGSAVIMMFRNISKQQLNISGEELMKRFVRGDSSRNTEGSGLGLSIARSLTELQNGRLDVQIDGDLFKVQITFPLTQA